MAVTNEIHLGRHRSLYLGDLPATDWHRHGAPVLLIGLSGRFRIQLADGRCESCHSALVDAEVEHIFDARGETIASLYLEPDAPEILPLRQQLLRQDKVAFDILPPRRRQGALERHLAAAQWNQLLSLPLQMQLGAALDQRICRVLPLLRTPTAGPLSRRDAADRIHLSESRFNHLFSQQMGVSFRRYRLWSQLRHTLVQLPQHRTLTEAALASGFADSAHFSRVFRDMFGLTPSSVLKGLRRLGQLEG